ncbi:hypothetical protein [Alloactinosynnema sp. L-07]|uniref:hypothetical protein n=1 Tax=Alloactinosynnema sp. L-07 TaxID=1653480 RepID=UPI00065F0AEB|nr:hypothetical protein [Alloactinosynnema sp. L-07]CRK59220.1 hypothetical protein [Alloactinosynnema sp. L-07]
MTAATAPRMPLYEQGLLRALRMVDRGRIGAFGLTAPLGFHSGDVPPSWLISALFVLRRDELAALGPAESGDGWRPAVLTSLGTALLAAWNKRLSDAKPYVLAVGTVTPVLHVVATEDHLPRVADTDDGPRWIALCRGLTRPERADRTVGVVLCERCALEARGAA